MFREAAKLIEDGEECFCCIAIDKVCGKSFSKERDYFERIVNPPINDLRTGWYGRISDTKNLNARVIALCLAAAVAESEGK